MTFRVRKIPYQPVHPDQDPATSSREWSRQMVQVRGELEEFTEPTVTVDGQRLAGSSNRRTMVEVTFGKADEDLRVDHDLGLVEVDYYPVGMDRPTTIYNGSKAGAPGYTYLRSSVPKARVRLLIFGRAS